MEETIKIKVPDWAEDIKDEGILVLLALLTKINFRYGWEEWYNFHRSDVNKIKGNLQKTNHHLDPYYPLIQVAKPYNDELQFKMKRVFKHHLVSVKLTDQRQIRVWCYLVGCLNHNLIDQDFYGARPPQSSAFTNEDEHHLFRSYDITDG